MKRPLFFAAAVAAQVAVLASMTLSHSKAQREGTPVVLRVIPVDPEDLFRGQYVQLGYEFSRVDFARGWEGPLPAEGGEIWVRLDMAGREWVAGQYRATRGEPRGGSVWMRGRCESVFAGGARAGFGIEQFFVREGLGPEIERAMRDGGVNAEVSVSADGEPALVALVFGGRRIE